MYAPKTLDYSSQSSSNSAVHLQSPGIHNVYWDADKVSHYSNQDVGRKRPSELDSRSNGTGQPSESSYVKRQRSTHGSHKDNSGDRYYSSPTNVALGPAATSTPHKHSGPPTRFIGNEELAEGPHLHEQAAGSFEHPWNLPIFNSSSTPSLRAQSSAGSGSHMSVRDMLGQSTPQMLLQTTLAEEDNGNGRFVQQARFG